MPVGVRPAMPTLPSRQGRRDVIVRRFATFITVLTAAIAVAIVTVAAVAFAIN
jgi:hypothetical protein